MGSIAVLGQLYRTGATSERGTLSTVGCAQLPSYAGNLGDDYVCCQLPTYRNSIWRGVAMGVPGEVQVPDWPRGS